MEYERTHSFQKKSSHTPQPRTQFSTRPFAAPVQMKPKEQLTPDELENEAFDQHKFEAFGLQLKEKSGTITPVEQERLGVLQAKMDDFWAQRRERASRFGYDFSKVSFTPREGQAAPQLQPMWRQGTLGMPMKGQRSLLNSSQQSPALPIQAKLTIGEPGDQYEQEADRVASQVVEQIHAPATAQSTQGQSVQRQEEQEGEEVQAKPEITAIQRQEEKPEELQAKSTLKSGEEIAGGEASTDLDTTINSARGGGQPLDAGLQRSMGQAMGADFSGVRVHTDAQSDQLNQSIQAKAFTTGQDVFFRQGEYNPGSRGGQELLAHELTHVVQQNGGAVQREAMPKEEDLQAKSILQHREAIAGGETSADLKSAINPARGSGQPLDADVQPQMRQELTPVVQHKVGAINKYPQLQGKHIQRGRIDNDELGMTDEAWAKFWTKQKTERFDERDKVSSGIQDRQAKGYLNERQESQANDIPQEAQAVISKFADGGLMIKTLQQEKAHLDFQDAGASAKSLSGVKEGRYGPKRNWSLIHKDLIANPYLMASTQEQEEDIKDLTEKVEKGGMLGSLAKKKLANYRSIALLADPSGIGDDRFMGIHEKDQSSSATLSHETETMPAKQVPEKMKELKETLIKKQTESSGRIDNSEIQTIGFTPEAVVGFVFKEGAFSSWQTAKPKFQQVVNKVTKEQKELPGFTQSSRTEFHVFTYTVNEKSKQTTLIYLDTLSPK